MLISLRNDHKEHLALLKNQSIQVLVDFCKLAIDYLNNGPNEKLYRTAAEKLSVNVENIHNCVVGLVNLILLFCKHKSNEADFRDSVLTLGFTEEQEVILNKFYQAKKKEINEILNKMQVKEPHFDNLEWRFELQVASRCKLHQVNPIMTMDLSLKTQKEDQLDNELEHHILQTDVNSLAHICNELEKALVESRGRYCRKLEKHFSNQ